MNRNKNDFLFSVPLTCQQKDQNQFLVLVSINIKLSVLENVMTVAENSSIDTLNRHYLSILEGKTVNTDYILQFAIR